MNPPLTNCSDSVERRFQFASAHPGGAHFAICDGSGRFISENIDQEVFRGLVTRSGQELIGEF